MAEKVTGQLFAGKYRIESLLRSSDPGNFYRCRNAFTERPVILRIMRPESADDASAAERFSNLSKAASRLSHPNILAISDFGESPDGRLYATFENIDGETLGDVLERDGRLSVPAALNVISQAAAGLAAAHKAGLIHGNLNAGSLLLTGETANVKVFDFGPTLGAAYNLPDADRPARDYAYVAPELCADRTAQPNESSDIYSLGVVAYEMLAGDVPFMGENAAEVIYKNIEAAPPPLSSFRSDLPPGVEPIVLKALSKNPEMRYRTASDFAEAIDLYTATSPTSSTASVAAAAGSGNLWKTAFIVLAGISLLSAFLIYGTSVKRTEPQTILRPDANGQPVQPINPATGVDEQNLALMPGAALDANSNTTMPQPPGTLPGGDGYNPWARGGVPPPGGPPASYVPPGGQVYTIDPNNPSQFMPADGGLVLVPIPANTNTAKPKPTPKVPAANANAPVATPTPAAKPAAKPASSPAKPVANTAPKE